MKYKQGLILGGVGFVLLLAYWGNARQEAVHSRRGFDYEVIKRPFALVYFYEGTKHTVTTSDYHHRLKDMKKSIAALSRLRRYKESNLRFISVNVNEDMLDELMHTYAIRRLPTFIIFQDGKPLRNDRGRIVQLHGFVSTRTLQEFIEGNIGDELAQERQVRREERLLRAEEAAYYWGYPYWGCWGYPYYYNGPCWSGRSYRTRPYVGFGFGYYV